jgi:hypothetical protein
VKKSTTIFFLTMYLMLSVGVTLSMHFCGDRITSIQLIPFASTADRCGCNDSTGPDDCCKTEIKSIQLHDDQLSIQTDQSVAHQTEITVWLNEPAAPLYASESIRRVLPTDSPPGSTPSYILQRALLI